jgi:hypothetical protein
MELLDFPAEILMEIMSKLDQKDRHLTAALVCKTFLQLTRSPQLMKCVKYQLYHQYPFQDQLGVDQSLLVMLGDNKHLEHLILGRNSSENILKILKVVAQHGTLRHLELEFYWIGYHNNQEEWNKVFSQICTRLTSFKSPHWHHLFRASVSDSFAPLVNAKFLTTLKLGGLPSSETFRQMADNYTCLQNFEVLEGFVDLSQISDMAYFLEKQSETLTSLKITTWNMMDLMSAISKCRNLKNLDLTCHDCDVNLDSLGSLSNLRNVFLTVKNCDLGHIIEAANFQHLNEIGFKFQSISVNLTENDISHMARTYGQQVSIKLNLFK